MRAGLMPAPRVVSAIEPARAPTAKLAVR
jgi:hypothetical protein